ncbi:MAG: DUF333 domain-containing protein [Anaerolineales bacterium]|nr:DUF333 domain-containing protein [Anaerolineales bacterium]
MKKRLIFIQILMILTFVGLSACASKPTEQSTIGIANPASQNCEKVGGVLTIEKSGNGGEFGVCTFEDNRQCEEWALFHGDCPEGGVDVESYVTPAARYCAIRGGEYIVAGNTGAEDEQGTCIFKNGKSCNVWQYFNMECSGNE